MHRPDDPRRLPDPPGSTATSEEERSARWVELCTLASELEARLMQGRLETEGIPCSLNSLRMQVEPVNLGRLSEVRLYVLDSDLERAQDLLRAAADGDYL